MAYIEYSDKNSPASNAVGSVYTPSQTSAPEQITPQTAEPMPDYIYQHNNQFGQTYGGAQPSVFAPTPADIAARDLYASQEALINKPSMPIDYGASPPPAAELPTVHPDTGEPLTVVREDAFSGGIMSAPEGYQPGIDAPITYNFPRVGTVDPTPEPPPPPPPPPLSSADASLSENLPAIPQNQPGQLGNVNPGASEADKISFINSMGMSAPNISTYGTYGGAVYQQDVDKMYNEALAKHNTLSFQTGTSGASVSEYFSPKNFADIHLDPMVGVEEGDPTQAFILDKLDMPETKKYGQLKWILGEEDEDDKPSRWGYRGEETYYSRDGGMPKQGRRLAQEGRHGDTMLVHMNPREMAGIASLAPNKSITTNPQTGLPEMFNFREALPMIAGIGSMFIPGLQPWGAALISGAATAIAEKDLGKGVMAGLMSYGMGSLLSTGAESAAASKAAEGVAAQQAVDPAMQASLTDAATTEALREPMIGKTQWAQLGDQQGGMLDTNWAEIGAYPAMGPEQLQAVGGIQQGTQPLSSLDYTATLPKNLGVDEFGNPINLPQEMMADQRLVVGEVARPYRYTGGERPAVITEGVLPSANRTNVPLSAVQKPGVSGIERPASVETYEDALAQFHNLDPSSGYYRASDGPEAVLTSDSPAVDRYQRQIRQDLLSAPTSTEGEGILSAPKGSLAESGSDFVDTVSDRLVGDINKVSNGQGGYLTEAEARKAGYIDFSDVASDAMYAGIGAYGTMAPMFEEEYEYPERQKRTYAPTRQIAASEYRVPQTAPSGYTPGEDDEFSYYGNKGGIVSNLPTIHARGGYNQNQFGGASSAKILERAIEGRQNRQAPTGGQQPQGMTPQPMGQSQQPQVPKTSARDLAGLMRSYMPSATAQEGTVGKTAKEHARILGSRVGATETIPARILGAGVGATETIPDHIISKAIKTAKKYGATDEEINKTPTSKLPDLARQYKSMSTEGPPIVTDTVTGKEYIGAPPIEKQAGGIAGVAEEEIPMGAEEVATIGIMEGAPEVIQEGVRDEAMLTEPSDPQNAEERAIYDRAVLALEGELEPSDAQNAIDEYIEVFGAQAYRALKEMVGQTRETGGMVRPANGETTVPDGELQGEDIIAGKIVDPMTGAETANLRVGENEYIKTGKDLANQALANGLPPTPQNGAMVEGMEEEALRRAFG
jgi:hypothetical protein